MTFERLVKKYTKPIFLAIVIVMAITLVISFGPGSGCDAGSRDTGADAGVAWGRPVTRAEFNDARNSVYAYARWKTLTTMGFASKSQMIQAIQKNMQGKWWGDPKPDKIDETAWERIILARYARLCGMATSKDEVRSEIISAYEGAKHGAVDMDQYAAFVRGVFAAEVEPFERVVEDSILIERMLALQLDAPAADYNEVMKRLLKDERRLRVDVGAFSPDDVRKELVPPGIGEILKHFEATKAKYQAPAKCQVEYLLADAEKAKAAAPEPEEEELKKYYDENKEQFLKKDDDHAGHDHEPGEKHYQSFDEVRLDIAGKVKTRAAEKAVVGVMNRANVELGTLDTARKTALGVEVAKDPAFADKTKDERTAEVTKRYREGSGDLLQKLLEKYGKEAGGLVHDISLPFSQKQIEDLEKVIGKASGSFKLASWIFESAQTGDLVPTVVKTDKGVVLFRLSRKIDSYATDLTDPIKQQIAKELSKTKLKDLAKKAAQDLVNKIQATPNRLTAFAEISAARPGFFKRTRYFKPDESGDLGLEDASLGRVAKAAAGKEEATKPGYAVQLDGSTAGGEKDAWSFAAVVSDVAVSMPEGLENRFNSERDKLEKTERNTRRTQIVKSITTLGNLIDHTKPKASPSPAP